MTTDITATALVVEDEEDLADLYVTWLREGGYTAYVAYGGEEALEKLDDSIDIVFLDRRMPGLSGDEVLETVVREGYSCRVAMVTAVEPDFDVIDMGFDDYLVKPVSKPDLNATVERLTKRNAYDDRISEYAALVSKKSALMAEKANSELESNERYEELERRIERLESTVDDLAEGFNEDDVAAVLRDMTVPPDNGTV